MDRTKEALAKKIKELERAEVIAHVVSDWAGIARTKRRNVLLLSKCFGGFKAYKESQKTQTQVNRTKNQGNNMISSRKWPMLS